MDSIWTTILGILSDTKYTLKSARKKYAKEESNLLNNLINTFISLKVKKSKILLSLNITI